jgi:hypothetical protein
MFKLFDRVKVNIATTGTGDITFGSASSNAFLTPTEAGAADGDTTRYVIVDGTDFEEGIGTIKSSVAAMERTTVTKSKIGGTVGTTKLDLSGTAVLAIPGSAQDILIPVNNLADLADADTALDNLGGTTVGKALFTATDEDAAQDAIGATAVGAAVLTATDAAAAREAIGLPTSGTVIDTSYAEIATYSTTTAVIPIDNSIPQNTEGTEIISASITPKTTTNSLRVRFSISMAVGSQDNIIVAMFLNSGTNAICARYSSTAANFSQLMYMEHEFVPGATTSQTVKIRVGTGSGSSLYINGNSVGRLLGGVNSGLLAIEEIVH